MLVQKYVPCLTLQIMLDEVAQLLLFFQELHVHMLAYMHMFERSPCYWLRRTPRQHCEVRAWLEAVFIRDLYLETAVPG